jgi:hypothetical protein
MNLFWKIALAGLGLVLLSLTAMWFFILFAQRRFNRMPDTHDLRSRVDKVANKYIGKRRHGGLTVGVLQKDTPTPITATACWDTSWN